VTGGDRTQRAAPVDHTPEEHFGLGEEIPPPLAQVSASTVPHRVPNTGTTPSITSITAIDTRRDVGPCRAARADADVLLPVPPPGDGRGEQCVEVADNLPGLITLRDSKDPTGPILVLNPADWRAFIAAAKDGTFDLP